MSRRVVRVHTENSRGSAMLGSIFEGLNNVLGERRVGWKVGKNIGHDSILMLYRKERFGIRTGGEFGLVNFRDEIDTTDTGSVLY